MARYHTARRRAGLLAALALGLAACAAPAADDPDDQAAGPEPSPEETAEEPAAERPDDSDEERDEPAWPWEAEAAGQDVPASVPLDEIRSGGPPPDGIPPIDEPVFESVAEAGEWLEPQDPVMVIDHEGEARAYPLAVLTYHEIVNDEIAGDPVLVTYCPLCNSGLVFDPVVDGEVLDFGTSGRLWRSNLVMYDRATRSLWSQFTGESIVGDHLGVQLERLPMQMVALSEYEARWPEGDVLSRDTGYDRPYGNNPYVGYDSSEDPFLFDGDTDGPLPQMARVISTGGEADPVAYPWEALESERVVADVVDGEPVVVLWAPGTASALDTASISDGEDVGAAAVFHSVVDGQELTFEPDGDERFRDAETGSTWTVLGEAVDGPLAGTQLGRMTHDDTFWFVQHAFRPDTRVEDPT